MKLKDKKIQILRPEIVKDSEGFGTTVLTPIHAGALWAYFRQLSGYEIFLNANTAAREEVLFTINWRDDLTTEMIVKYRDKLYNITRIDVFEGYRADISLYCVTSAEKGSG